jgi:hypothetical protein
MAPLSFLHVKAGEFLRLCVSLSQKQENGIERRMHEEKYALAL